MLGRLFVPLLAAASSGCMLAASFPPLDAGFLAWLALVPVFIVVVGVGAWRAGLLGWLMGAVYAGLFLYWIRVIPGFPIQAHLLLILYISAFYALFGYALRRVVTGTGAPLMLVAPALWVSLEFIRVNAGFLGVPGGLLGHSQYENIALIQIASFTSAYGLSFLIVLVNAAVAQAILWLWSKDGLQTRLSGISIATTLSLGPLLVSLVYFWGSHQIKSYDDESGSRLRIAVVQANISPEIKWDRKHRSEVWKRYRRLTRLAARDDPDLIVWPESALPVYLRAGSTNPSAILALVGETGVPLVLGSATSAKFTSGKNIRTEFRNSAFLLNREGKIVSGYDKLRLVPFAEYVPLKGRISWPAWLLGKGDPIFAGTDITLFELSGRPFGVAICWESLFPDLFREFVHRGARFMLNISEESWFDGSQASRQILAITVFRAVEHRVALVRSVNTGISAAIDPLGVVRARVTDPSGRDMGVSGVFTVAVPTGPVGTFYTRYGDVFAMACVIMALALLTFALIPEWVRIGRSHRRLGPQFGRLEDFKQRMFPAGSKTLDRK